MGFNSGFKGLISDTSHALSNIQVSEGGSYIDCLLGMWMRPILSGI